MNDYHRSTHQPDYHDLKSGGYPIISTQIWSECDDKMKHTEQARSYTQNILGWTCGLEPALGQINLPLHHLLNILSVLLHSCFCLDFESQGHVEVVIVVGFG